MIPKEMTWSDAALKVLKDSGEPLHYQKITELIGEWGLKTLTGATPTRTVNRELHSLVDTNHASHNPNVQKMGKGVFLFVDPLEPTPQGDEDELEEEELAQLVDAPQSVRVQAYGLNWVKDRVSWGKGEILGRQKGSPTTVNFAEQRGIYLLHQGDSVVYVGRASQGPLHGRLNQHRRSRKALRWDKFSWFGFREVNDDGILADFSGELGITQLITILEGVLIEAFQPPVNGQRGEGMGELYEQVSSPDIASQQSRDFLQRLSGG